MRPRSAARNQRAACPLEFELGSSLVALLVIAPRPPKVGDSRGSKDKFWRNSLSHKYILAEGGPRRIPFWPHKKIPHKKMNELGQSSQITPPQLGQPGEGGWWWANAAPPVSVRWVVALVQYYHVPPQKRCSRETSSQKISRPTPTTHPQRVPSGSTHAPKKPPKSRIWPTPYGGEGVCLRLIPLAQIPACRRLTSTCRHFSQISSTAKAVPHAIWRAHVRSLTGG